jgi:hypothetical protein
MIKQALEYLINLGKPEILEINGQQYSTKRLEHIGYPTPSALSITTLTGLIDYIKSGIDFNAKKYDGNCDCESAPLDDLLIQVSSPTNVRLYSPLWDDENRGCYIECNAITPRIVFNQFMEIEPFNIMVQSCFQDEGDAGAVLAVAANVKEQEVRESIDDGVTQEVTIKAGVQRLKTVEVPNPVVLKPFRTFIEVEQPMSKFVFRMQNGPRAALYESDGGAWQLEAMRNIKSYLEKELQGYSVKVIS